MKHQREKEFVVYRVWEVKNEDNRIIHIQGPYESQTPPPKEVLDSLFPGMTHKFPDQSAAFIYAQREGHRIVSEDGRRNPRIAEYDTNTGKTTYHQV
jgi:hypothetical protein